MGATKFVLLMVAMIAGIWSFMSFGYSAGFAPFIEFLWHASQQLPISYEDAFNLWYVGGIMLLVFLLIVWVTAIYFLLNFLYSKFWESSNTA